MTKRTLYKVALGLLLAAALAATAAIIVVPRLLDLNAHRAYILSMARQALHRRVFYESASFSWNVTPSFVFRGITIAETSGNTTFLKVDRLTFKLSILPLLHREVRLKELVVERPELMLTRNQTGVFNIDDLFRGEPAKFSIHLKSVRIMNGLVRFTDNLAAPEGFTTSLENLDLQVSGLGRGKSSAFKLSTMVPGEKGQTAIAVSGTARIPGQKESFSDASFDVTLSAKNFGPDRYWPYYGRYLPFEKMHGSLDLDGRFKGKPNEFTAKGHLRINDLRLNYPQVFHAPLTPRKVRLAYEIELTPRDLSVNTFDLSIDGLRVAGSCALRNIHSNDPRITARAATSQFRLEEFRQYIPYGIIVKDVADFIEQHIMGGIYRLDEGRLDGRVSQILHMERGDNYNVLSIRGHVEKGLVTFGPNVPPFNSIKGELEMRGKDFLLRGMTGHFGSSTFTLEGKIADYPLDTPASYPFTMAISPGEAEVAWLFRQRKSPGMAFSGQSLLRFSGSGTPTDYRLAGSWDLTGADYRYRQLVHKPSGMANQVRFAVHLGKTAAQLADFQYQIPSFDVTATATYRYNDQRPLTFAATTNRFQVTSLLSVMSCLEKYHPSGTVEARFGGSGNPAEPDAMKLKGDVALENFSARPVEQIKPLEKVGGTVHITEDTLETEQLTGNLGNSPFTVKGRVAGLSDPAADLLFSFPELHLADLGFQSPEQIPEVRNLSGNIALKDKNIEIMSLSGEVARSRFSMSGEVLDIGKPKITVRADFPYARVEDLAPLTRLQRAGNNGERTPDITLKATVTAAAGSIRDITFEKLDTELTLNNDLLDVHSLTVGVFGGIVSGNGKADFAADGGPMYQTHYRLERVDATRLLRVTGTEHHLTGRLAGEGEVSFQGNNLEDMKNTTLGYAEIMLTDGALHFPATGGLSERHEFPFKKAQARLSYAGKVLDVTWVRIEAFEGVITGDGRADFRIPDRPGYRLACHLENINAAVFFRAFDVTRELTGNLKLDAELTARGDSVAGLKKNLEGTVSEHLEKGIIKKYGFISKIFSILNVSQLLDYRLPDVMSTGMPFDDINGTYHFKDGKVSTRDLTIRSPSVNMTIVGEADILAREIDVKIGVQPLQTVGKVISRIPVIGWVLTGKKKRFLVVYYEAKGKWDDPTVSTIPQTSISSGVLNIFERTLYLPEELINKPGEVIFGN